MGIISGFSAVAFGSALPPWDDWWYTRPGWDSAAGMSVTPESAMQLAAVFSCVRVVSETLGLASVHNLQAASRRRKRARDRSSALPRPARFAEHVANVDGVYRDDAGASRAARQRVREDRSGPARRDRSADPSPSGPGAGLPPSQRQAEIPGAFALHGRSGLVHAGRNLPSARAFFRWPGGI